MAVTTYRPMLATPWPNPFSDPAWSFELKWDGIRAILVSAAGEATLRSRNGNVISGRYPELSVQGIGAVLDGEIVAMDAQGRPSFELLQARTNSRAVGGVADAVPAHFVAFDLLEVRGLDLRSRSFDERRAELTELDLPQGFVVSDLVLGEGEALFAAVQDQGLEGMVAKRRASRYQSGIRSPDWRKVLNMNTATVVVGGYLPSESGRALQSLVVGLWDGERLRYVGSVGSGFAETSLMAIREGLDQMKTDDAVFLPDPALEGAVLVEPILVAHVNYRTWTRGGRLRHPVFKGFGDEEASALTWAREGPGSAGEGADE